MERTLGSKPVHGFWCSSLYNQMKIRVDWFFLAFKKLVLAPPQPHCWLNCRLWPDSPITWDGRKMGSSSRWALYSCWTPGTGLSKLHFQTGKALPVGAGAAFWASISHTQGGALWGHWRVCQNNVWPHLKSGRCSNGPPASHRAGSRAGFAQHRASLPWIWIGMS